MGCETMLSELTPLTTLSQSTHPCRGDIDNLNGMANSVVVSIHAPCRVRLPNHSPIPWKLEVSIHVPTQGATVQAPLLLLDVLRWIEIPNDCYHLFDMRYYHFAIHLLVSAKITNISQTQTTNKIASLAK